MNMLSAIPLPPQALTPADRLELAHREACQVVDDLGEILGGLYAERRPLGCKAKTLANQLSAALRQAARARDEIGAALEVGND